MKIEDIEVNGKCFICRKKFVKPFKKETKVSLEPFLSCGGVTPKKEGDDISEIEIVTSHTRCRNLVKKREKLIKQLVEIDFDLFCMRDCE
jgi:hypothetical protein